MNEKDEVVFLKADAFDIRWAESFSITQHIRWNAGVLEQLWQGSQGTPKWEKVPNV